MVLTVFIVTLDSRVFRRNTGKGQVVFQSISVTFNNCEMTPLPPSSFTLPWSDEGEGGGVLPIS